MGGSRPVINYMRDAVDGKHQLTVLVPDVFEQNWRYAAKLMNIPPNRFFIAALNVVSREVYKHFTDASGEESYGLYAATVDKVFEEYASFTGANLDA